MNTHLQPSNPTLGAERATSEEKLISMLTQFEWDNVDAMFEFGVQGWTGHAEQNGAVQTKTGQIGGAYVTVTKRSHYVPDEPREGESYEDWANLPQGPISYTINMSTRQSAMLTMTRSLGGTVPTISMKFDATVMPGVDKGGRFVVNYSEGSDVQPEIEWTHTTPNETQDLDMATNMIGNAGAFFTAVAQNRG